MDTLRIGDADREAALAQLGEHYALGRLSKDELDERSDAVWSARTRGDLAPVFADLPTPHPGDGPAKPPHAAGRGRRRPFPLVPVLIALGVITVLTHLPVILIAAGLWFFWLRPRWSSRGLPRGSCAGSGSHPWRASHG